MIGFLGELLLAFIKDFIVDVVWDSIESTVARISLKTGTWVDATFGRRVALGLLAGVVVAASVAVYLVLN